MKRWLRYLLTYLCLLAAAFTWGRERLSREWQAFQEWNAMRSVVHVERSFTYVLDDQEQLRFSIPPGSSLLRVMVTANLRGRHYGPPPEAHRPGWTLDVAYSLYDRRGHQLRSGKHACRASRTLYLDSSGQIVSGTFYFRDVITPLASQEFHILLRDLPADAARIEFRLGGHDSSIVDAGVRLSAWQENTNYDRPGEWQRLSPRRRELITRASVRPAELLTSQERLNLLRWNWKPLAPYGMEGRDYARRTLYRRDVEGLHEIDSDPVPAGLYISEERAISIPLPVTEGRLRLTVARESTNIAPQVRFEWSLQADWYADRYALPQVFRFSSEEATIARELPLQGGLLVVRSSLPAQVRAFWRPVTPAENEQITEEIEITPSRRATECYPAPPPTTLRYAMTHVGRHATPVRVTARVAPKSSGTTTNRTWPCQFQWRACDAQHRTVAQGSCFDDLPCTTFDMLRDSRQPLSDPRRYYFRFPANVVALELSAPSHDVLLQVETALPDLPQVTVASASFEEPEVGGTHDWYAIHPEGVQFLRKYHLAEYVLLQTRPPQPPSEELLTGYYDWDDFSPPTETPGRFILLPRGRTLPVRDRAAHSVFVALPTDTPWNFDASREEARLVYVRKSSPPYSASPDLSEPVVHGYQGELRIPPHTTSQMPDHRAIMVPAADRMFVSVGSLASMPADATQYLKRFAYEFQSDEMEFIMEKRTPNVEQLNIQYLPIAADPMVRLDVELHLDSEMPSFAADRISFPQHTFYIQVHAGDDAQGHVLGTTDEIVHVPPSCMLPLGNDLPPGKYRLKIRRSNPSPAYLIVSRLILGMTPEDDIATGPLP